MKLNNLLNSDMKTIVGEANRAFLWWVEELRSLVPPRMRDWRSTKSPILFFDTIGRFTESDGAPATNGSPSNATIVVCDQAVLQREVIAPAMSRSDLAQMLSLNCERYFPLPGASLILAQSTDSIRTENGVAKIGIAALPLVHADALAAALKAAAITPRSVRIGNRDLNADPRFDFLSGMRAAGLLPPRSRRRAIWWTVVAAFALLNLVTLILRDAAENERLQALVDAQRPAVTVAQRMTSQMRSVGTVAQRVAARRAQREPLGALAATTIALPDGAWVQRYAWDGASVRLTGYRMRDADVAAALRRSDRFANVKTAQTDSMGETVTGQPFDLTAEIRGR